MFGVKSAKLIIVHKCASPASTLTKYRVKDIHSCILYIGDPFSLHSANMEDDYSEEEGAGSAPGHPEGPLPRRTAAANAVPSVTLPPFWVDNPAAWFALA